ncbi:hypothetical protein [Bdellovibrio sp. HCB337]|uniref:hypothetical protein n=1 Tax=Bdellovibrio sp. HCB337 TaxID=3394358 RepID=UPI0039A42C79
MRYIFFVLLLVSISQARAEEWPWKLPFLAQKAVDTDHTLPRPYGLSWVYYYQDQAINVEDLQVAFDPSEPLRDITFIDFGGARVQNHTLQLKLDAWVLPFFNVFGILGGATGKGTIPISIKYKDLFDFFVPGACAGGSPPAFCEGYITAAAPADYNGYDFGVGFLLAAGYKDFFFAMPATYVVTDINVSTTNITAINVTPRLGYSLSTEYGKLGLYLGANYLDARGVLTGTYLLPLSATAIGRDVSVQFKLRESPVALWNGIGGFNWEISPFWSITSELSLNKDRQSITFVFANRF